VYKFGSKVICFLRILFTPLNSINEPITNIFVTGAVLHQQKANVFSFAFQALSFDSHNLTVPIIKWLGVLPSDIERYNQHDHKKEKTKPQISYQQFSVESIILKCDLLRFVTDPIISRQLFVNGREAEPVTNIHAFSRF